MSNEEVSRWVIAIFLALLMGWLGAACLNLIKKSLS
jgi:hypothetical protein